VEKWLVDKAICLSFEKLHRTCHFLTKSKTSSFALFFETLLPFLVSVCITILEHFFTDLMIFFALLFSTITKTIFCHFLLKKTFLYFYPLGSKSKQWSSVLLGPSKKWSLCCWKWKKDWNGRLKKGQTEIT